MPWSPSLALVFSSHPDGVAPPSTGHWASAGTTNPWFLQPVSGQGQIRAQQMGLGAEFRFPQVPDPERARLPVAKSSRLPSAVPGVQAEQDCPPAPGVSGAGELALTEVMPSRPVPAVTQR